MVEHRQIALKQRHDPLRVQHIRRRAEHLLSFIDQAAGFLDFVRILVPPCQHERQIVFHHGLETCIEVASAEHLLIKLDHLVDLTLLFIEFGPLHFQLQLPWIVLQTRVDPFFDQLIEAVAGFFGPRTHVPIAAETMGTAACDRRTLSSKANASSVLPWRPKNEASDKVDRGSTVT